MKYKFYFLFATILSITSCNNNEISVTSESDNPLRYNEEVFSNTTITNNVVYGSSITLGGVTTPLLLDIYEPKEDTHTNRPLLVLAHGGSFIGGNKNDLSSFATYLAKSGYVVASISYRLLDSNSTDTNLKKVVINAVTDMKAAVRFFNKDKETINTYKINASNIFIGGYSAGAITALHYAYLNNEQELISIGGNTFLEYVNNQGGLEGISGNPNYSSTIKGVINISGALFKANFVNVGEPILYSIHGTNDNVIPYNQGVIGGTNLLVEGSGLIHPQATNSGIVNKLKTIQNGNHGAFISCAECMSETRAFLFRNL